MCKSSTRPRTWYASELYRRVECHPSFAAGIVRSQSVRIGSLSFASKQEGILFFRRMLSRYADGEDVSEADSAHLRSLLGHHSETQNKVGAGVRRFYRNRTTHGTSCFWFERLDGSIDTFSFAHCFKSERRPVEEEFEAACRETVRKDMRRYREEYLRCRTNERGIAPCEITGQFLPPAELEVHHASPCFKEIVAGFIGKEHLALGRSHVTPPCDRGVITAFTDIDLAMRFRKYHDKIAHLQVVSRVAHRTLKKHRKQDRVPGAS